MRIVFAGTPHFAAQHLQALLNNDAEVVAVYTQPDRPAGRGKKLQHSNVKTLALANNLPVCQPASLKTQAAQEALKLWNADLMVVVAYGIILPKAVLDTPTHGCINVHGSLLPKWRGAAPIQRAIWAGDTQTGVTIMQLDEGLDTGPMLHKAYVDITPTDTSESMYTKLADIGPEALIYAINNLNQLQPEVQNSELASHAKKLSKEEARIDWSLPAEQLERNTRAFNPWPISWFMANDQPIKVWKATIEPNSEHTAKPGQIVRADKFGLVVATSTQSLVLKMLQLPGKKPMPFADVLNARGDWFAKGIQL